MTELDTYLGVDVHVDIWPLGVCAPGRLRVVDGELRFSAAPHWALPLYRLRAHPIPFGPEELPDSGDLVLTTEQDLISIWRDRPHEHDDDRYGDPVL